jgi:hypothetical protein
MIPEVNITTTLYSSNQIINQKDVAYIAIRNYGTVNATIIYNDFERTLTPLDGKGLPTAEFEVKISGFKFELKNLKMVVPTGAKLMVDMATVKQNC